MSVDNIDNIKTNSHPHRPNPPYWFAEIVPQSWPVLREAQQTDVCVIGGGVMGLTVALMLQSQGQNVVLLEADRLGAGTTGHSTAKITALHGMKYRKLLAKYGKDVVQIYGSANQAGLEKILAWVGEFAIDCDLNMQDAYTYTTDAKKIPLLKEELEASKIAALDSHFTKTAHLPFSIKGAVKVKDQAYFHPLKYSLGLAEKFTSLGGLICEKSRALKIHTGESCVVETPHASVHAHKVVVATLLPFYDRGGYFARTFPEKSYALEVALREQTVRGMYINIDQPLRSIRPLGSANSIIVGGENHPVGQDSHTKQKYEELKAWAEKNFQVESIRHQWSAQDYLSVDDLPYIGAMPLTDDKVFLATGFAKWGFTTATYAAMIISDLILEKDNPWAKTFCSKRVQLAQALKKFSCNSLNVVANFFGDRLKAILASDIGQLKKGEACVCRHKSQAVAAYLDPQGTLHTLSPVCTHMGCFVTWNDAELSWDCPCHGSRFDIHGNILQGPATKKLEKIKLSI